ncbi:MULTISPECIES: hypothetical protein [unclassified Rhodococcus (in: high G+C Gram-positive bacteria)]|uniref:hypothetical protein n=1 Tax=unclassified Rhodococcus (in: high G+C Gram-positive bacteria) TaxID=192944 RepID=UPI0003723A13|nr:hypothetical protein [Rhodococcus sp. DK17]
MPEKGRKSSAAVTSDAHRGGRGPRVPAGYHAVAGAVTDVLRELAHHSNNRVSLGPCVLGDLRDLRMPSKNFLEGLDPVPLVDADVLTNALGEPMVLYPRLFRIVISSSNEASISDGLFGRFQI